VSLEYHGQSGNCCAAEVRDRQVRGTEVRLRRVSHGSDIAVHCGNLISPESVRIDEDRMRSATGASNRYSVIISIRENVRSKTYVDNMRIEVRACQ
jgi:hypothetical protein